MKAGWTKQGMRDKYPTLEDRAKHRAWLVLHCQARFRGEHCDISEEDFFDIWREHWTSRGRGANDMTLTRQDPELPWTRDNIEIITRAEHLRREKNFWKGQ